jgi:predicted phosphoribosyltransferase
MVPHFTDRREAGKQLAQKLMSFAGRNDVIVLALPRGGVPVAFEVASALQAPLDLMLVRKLGVPGQEELAMGALALPDVRVFNHEVIRNFGVSEEDLDRSIIAEERELFRRNQAYRGGAPPPTLEGKAVILVDDGIATGANMRAAVTAVEQQNPLETIVAVPVCSHDASESLRVRANLVLCLQSPEIFFGVGQAYQNFDQTSDEEVLELLKQAKHFGHHHGPLTGECHARTSL